MASAVATKKGLGADELDRCVFNDDEIREQIKQFETFIERALELLPENPTAEEKTHVLTTLKKVEEVQAELQILRARVDFNDFAEFVMTDDETGLPLRQAPIHRRWAELCLEYSHLIIWSHRSSGKTTQISVARTVWELGRDPTLRFLILSNTAEIATRIVKSISTLIEDNDRVKQIFPHLKPNPKGPWTNTQLQVVRESNSPSPSVRAAGIHGSVTGMRVDRAIIDDILDYENTNTEAERKKTMGWYKATVPGCLTRRARVLVVGTAYNPHDFIHEIARVRGYRWFRFPLIAADMTITWPEAWTPERIDHQRVELGPAEFARQFLCKARDDEESRFRQEWFDKALARGNGLPLVETLEDLPEDEQAVVKAFTGVDLSTGKKKKKTDKSAFFHLLQYPNGDRRIAMIESGKFTGPQIIERVESAHERYRSIIAVEDNGCFHPETRVLTFDGYKPIEDVAVGERVLTHLGRWRKVLERKRTIYSGDLVGLKSAGALTVWTTPNHPFYVRTAGRVQGSRTTKDVGKYRPSGEPMWMPSASTEKGVWGHYLSMPRQTWPEIPAELPVSRYLINRTVEVTEELALLLGLFLAEGSSSTVNDQVAFAFHDDEQYLRDFVTRIAKYVFGASTHENQGDGRCRRVTVNSCELKQICQQMGKSTTKAMPFEWMGWPLNIRLAVVRGWLLGDGCLMYNNLRAAPARIFVGQSISRNLVAQMRATLVEAGLRPSLLPIKEKTSTIDGRKIFGKAAFKLSLCADDTDTLLALATSDLENVRWVAGREPVRERTKESGSPLVLEQGVVWGKLKTKETRPYTGMVHNLVVEEDESYIVEDLAAHNSQAYILQFAAEKSNVPVVPHTTGKQKRDPVLGVEGLAIELANGKWIIPNDEGVIHPEIAEFITDCLYFDPKQHTSDRLMSCYFAREVARKYAGEPTRGRQASMRVIGPDAEATKDEPYREGVSLRKLFDVPDSP